jgi:hypothetical protein
MGKLFSSRQALDGLAQTLKGISLQERFIMFLQNYDCALELGNSLHLLVLELVEDGCLFFSDLSGLGQ